MAWLGSALLVQEGCVKPLVTLMMSGNTMAQTESVSLLAVLCEEEGVPLEILELGALPTLVDLVEAGQEEARAHAAGVLMLAAVRIPSPRSTLAPADSTQRPPFFPCRVYRITQRGAEGIDFA